MEDVRMKFYGVGDREDATLETYCNNENEIFISIDDEAGYLQWITLNKATAAQLVKKLKLEISKINQDGTR